MEIEGRYTLRLTPRLKIIADSIENCKCIADIGSDHAYLPIYLVKHNKTEKAIATDINVGPANISKKRVQQHGLLSFIDIRIGYGLNVLKNNEAEVMIISGMGGLLIIDILKEGLEVAKSTVELILQPMRDSYLLRKWLIENGFKILDVEIVKEGSKFYEILWARPCDDTDGTRTINYIDDKLLSKKSPILKDYIDSKIDKYETIIEKVKTQNTSNSLKRLKECSNILEYYKGVKDCLWRNAEL